MTTHARPIAHCSSNEHQTPSWYNPGRCVVGFKPAQQQQQSSLQPSLSRGRSLLSERLSNKAGTVVVYECHHASQDGSSEDEEEEADLMDDDGTDEGAYFDDDWAWLSARDSSIQESDRSSHASSQPIQIPASCYFKDEVQRQALDKLNQKRKWYQQQLEAERMMARSMAKSRQAAAAARGNKPNGRPGARA